MSGFKRTTLAPLTRVRPNWYTSSLPKIHWTDETGAMTLCGRPITNNFSKPTSPDALCARCATKAEERGLTA